MEDPYTYEQIERLLGSVEAVEYIFDIKFFTEQFDKLEQDLSAEEYEQWDGSCNTDKFLIKGSIYQGDHMYKLILKKKCDCRSSNIGRCCIKSAKVLLWK